MKERILFLEAMSGVSGDMFLGALASLLGKLGTPFDFDRLVSHIAVSGVRINVSEGARGGIAGVRVDVVSDERHSHRGLPEVRKIIANSGLSSEVRTGSARAFTALAEAEARVHGVSVEKIHFHEVGAIDAIVDIVGTMGLMEALGWPKVLHSPVNVGSGTVECAHGVLPVPAPATAELLTGIEIRSLGEPCERTTPTGAALLRVLAGVGGCRPLPQGRIAATGIGLGGRDTKHLPNVLRAILFEPAAESPRFLEDAPCLVETNIDDSNPQDLPPVLDRLLGAGALDAWCENISMKKGRLGVKLCCLAPEERLEALCEIILRETTTLGVRLAPLRRLALRRGAERVVTAVGELRVKTAELDGVVLRKIPEFEDIAAIARERGLPIPTVRELVAGELARDKKTN